MFNEKINTPCICLKCGHSWLANSIFPNKCSVCFSSAWFEPRYDKKEAIKATCSRCGNEINGRVARKNLKCRNCKKIVSRDYYHKTRGKNSKNRTA